jgi:3-hydroxymyristoyl/3-hydroxydecanoyl-(acyl carrier protein) dehydratase
VFAADAVPALVRQLKRTPILPDGTGTPVAHGGDALDRLLPHRPPMRLVDGVDAVDLAARAVRGHRRLAVTDLGFAGHFPKAPIYPGVLTVEAMGQLGLTLLHFTTRVTTDVPADIRPAAVRAIHIHHASFLAPFQPGDTMTLHARVVEHDYTVVAACQAWRGDTLAAFAISEVFIDE